MEIANALITIQKIASIFPRVPHAATVSVPRLFTNTWIYRLFTTDSAVIVHGVHMSRFLLPSYFIYVIIGILSGALRGTGKVLVPMLLTCGGVCSLRILWLFTAGQMYSGINTIMLSYPDSWSITAVLFIVYYFMKFPGKKKEN